MIIDIWYEIHLLCFNLGFLLCVGLFLRNAFRLVYILVLFVSMISMMKCIDHCKQTTLNCTLTSALALASAILLAAASFRFLTSSSSFNLASLPISFRDNYTLERGCESRAKCNIGINKMKETYSARAAFSSNTRFFSATLFDVLWNIIGEVPSFL